MMSVPKVVRCLKLRLRGEIPLFWWSKQQEKTKGERKQSNQIKIKSAKSLIENGTKAVNAGEMVLFP